MTQAPSITNEGLLVASVFVLLAGAASYALRLQLGARLAVAAVRTVLQLSLVGLALVWLFDAPTWWMLAAVVLSMLVNAGIAGVRRTERRFDGIWSRSLIAITLSSSLTTFVVLRWSMGLETWYQPRYLIPILGMVLGNALTGISLGLDRLMSDLEDKAPTIEADLAHGATRWEACRPVVREACRTGLVPILNSMSVVGIVSLPGMMTGQILQGASPEQAVRYQIVVMFMLAGATSIGTIAVVLMSFRRLVTPRHQLDLGRIRRHGKR